MIIVASAAAGAAVGVVTAAVTAAVDQKKYDDEKPDHVVVVENIAKTAHNILPSPFGTATLSKSKFRKKKRFLPLSVIIL